MTNVEIREECISNLIQQIDWIEEIDAHKFPGWGHTVGAMRQAVALLKAQEPVSVQKKHMEMVGLQTWDWACGNCGQTVLFSARFCPWCGRAVKWDG